MAVKRIAILGSTGSIGVNTLDVISAHPDRFRVVSLSAGSNHEKLIAQAHRFQPEAVAIRNPEGAAKVREALANTAIQVLEGEAGVCEAAAWDSGDVAVSAIVGADGLQPTLAAIRSGKDIALANKECLVMAGALFHEEVARYKVDLIPVDSEHNAIFQVLYNGAWLGVDRKERANTSPALVDVVRSLVLTASGGPLRSWSKERLATVTPEEALAHPNWKMGRKISIDSATCMNKGLEVIEAHWLFGIPPEHISVVVHPESIVHSMVTYRDGSVLAQMGMPDMRTPIAVALAWPERISTPVPALDLPTLGRLTFFEAPEKERFPCLDLAYQALSHGGSAPAILNAANEVAVAAFLDGKMGFQGIAAVIDWTLSELSLPPPDSIESVLDVDRLARERAWQWVAQHGSGLGGTS
ncbi:MAG: 1-deoxy-D-xylulose-5-phosphate reductoisomerase [Magnetococcales bacterium]|nr:1-deoxy-D-xylulose-5-phosphate reductoisomerase [Magnetococcales bacterium]